MKRSFRLAALLSMLILVTVETTAAPSKKQQDYDNWLLSNQPFDKVPLVLDEMEDHGTMTPARHQKLLAEWKAKKPEWDRQQAANHAKDLAFRKKKEQARARDLAALTPAQRLNLEMREKELAVQQQRQDAEAESRADQARQQRQENIRAALAGMASNANAQIQANQARQADFNNKLILQGVQNATARPRTYDSTITPSYPGGPVAVHTEQTGGN
jgi:hypothetical protein